MRDYLGKDWCEDKSIRAEGVFVRVEISAWTKLNLTVDQRLELGSLSIFCRYIFCRISVFKKSSNEFRKAENKNI